MGRVETTGWKTKLKTRNWFTNISSRKIVLLIFNVFVFNVRTQYILAGNRFWGRKRKFRPITIEISHFENICEVKGHARFCI